jgi:uncharacterized protein YjbJ (UPF0337 family)
MNWHQVQGSWNQVKGKAKQMWGDLMDDALDTIAGKRGELVGRLHQVWHQQVESPRRRLDQKAIVHAG